MEIQNMCNYLNNNIFMNYGGLGGYQYGMNIADLFTGVKGLNSVWNFNNCGFSNLGYGYGCGSNSNSSLGWGIGYAVTNVLGSIGLSWAASARANKAQEKAAAREAVEKHAKDLDNAIIILNIKGLTKSTIQNATNENKQELICSINNQKYSKESELKTARDTVTRKTTTLSNFESHLNNQNNKVSELESAYNTENAKSSKDDSKVKEALDNLNKAKEGAKDIQKSIDSTKKELEKAEANVKELEKEKEIFTKAQNTVIDEINANAEANAKKAADDENKNLDIADGNIFNRTIEKNKKYSFDNKGSIILPNGQNINNFTNSDWRGIIKDYRNGNPAKQKAIIQFIKTNWSSISSNTKINSEIYKGLEIINSKTIPV